MEEPSAQFPPKHLLAPCGEEVGMHLPSKKMFFLSYWEAFFYALMVASSESFALYLAVKYGLSSVQISLVSTVPLLLGAACQWAIPWLLKNEQVRHGIVVAMSTQVLGMGGLLYYVHKDHEFRILFASLCVYWMGGLSASPLWLDWMSNHVPAKLFRRFISRRSSFVSLVTVSFFLCLAYVFFQFPELPVTWIFIVGLAARFLSLACQLLLSFVLKLSLYQTRLPLNPRAVLGGEKVDFSGETFQKILKLSIFWTGIFKFAVFLCSPFFLPYMVNELKFSMWDFSVVTGMALIGRSLFLGVWSRASFGMMPFIGLQISSLCISILPLLWTLSSDFTYIAMLQFCAGIVWGGFDLSTILIVQNFIKTSSRKYLGIHMAIMNFFAILGASVGAWLLKQDYSYISIFGLSSTLRLLIAGTFVYQISKWPVVRLTILTLNGYLTSALSFKSSTGGHVFFPKIARKGKRQL
ncbi:MAG: hypothetical protein HYW48_09920 [Deltaproteobacteria bacterium]|nr:hypothetical protein [Deltaproteobacteria bacterium]